MRAAIFIDGGYLLQQLKTERATIDYSILAQHLLVPIRRDFPLDLLRCYFYYCAPWMPDVANDDANRRMENHKQFVAEIERLSRWQMRLGKLEKRWDGQKDYFEQKRVDVLLSCDMVRHAAAGHIQHAVLVAGDSDFIPAVQAAKESGVTISLWRGPMNTVHKDLIALADEVNALDFSKLRGRSASSQQSNQQANQQQRPAQQVAPSGQSKPAEWPKPQQAAKPTQSARPAQPSRPVQPAKPAAEAVLAPVTTATDEAASETAAPKKRTRRRRPTRAKRTPTS